MSYIGPDASSTDRSGEITFEDMEKQSSLVVHDDFDPEGQSQNGSPDPNGNSRMFGLLRPSGEVITSAIVRFGSSKISQMNEIVKNVSKA